MTTFRIARRWMDLRPTAGELFGGDLSLFTLEDPWLDNQPNVSCIPTGIFPVNITWSQRFKRYMPEIQNVSGRSGIRIHWGNTDADTTGCVLLGTVALSDDSIGHSKQAFGYFISWLYETLQDGRVEVEVSVNA